MTARRVFRSLEDLFRRTAAEKRDAALARKRGRDTTAEPSAQVYAAACAEVASHFEPLGFEYAKSGPHFTRRSGDFRYRVSFQSSYLNVSGRHVALLVQVGVFCRPLKAWRSRQAHPYGKGDIVAGGLVGNLLQDHPYIQWELGDERDRSDAIRDIVETIRTIALPYFERFSDPRTLASWLRSNELPGIWPGVAVEFVDFYEGPDGASAVVSSHLRRHARFVPDFIASCRRFAEEGFPLYFPTKIAEQLAWVVVSYGLHPSIEGAA